MGHPASRTAHRPRPMAPRGVSRHTGAVMNTELLSTGLLALQAEPGTVALSLLISALTFFFALQIETRRRK